MTTVSITQEVVEVTITPAGQPAVALAVPAAPQVVVQPVGAQGPPGPAAMRYTHPQVSPATEWTVNHNLGVLPSVTVLSAGSIEIEAEIVHVTANQTLIRFNTPQAGMAIFS